MRQDRPKVWKPSARVRAFLAAYRLTASITKSAQAAGIRREAHYRLLERSEQYRREFAAATIIAADTLEDEAVRRAVEGQERPVTYHGLPVLTLRDPANPDSGTVALVEREQSDQLLLALLKAKKPREYRDRVEHGLDDAAQGSANKFTGTMQEALELYRRLVAAG